MCLTEEMKRMVKNRFGNPLFKFFRTIRTVQSISEFCGTLIIGLNSMDLGMRQKK